MRNKGSRTVEVVTPIVHLNGTGKGDLEQVRLDVYDALGAALDALRQMAPNGRDYYPEPGRMDRAVEQHERRMRMISGLQDEIVAELDAMSGI